ncbi:MULTISPECIES: ATP-dependent nuclease [Aureimonas]|nr:MULTISPECIES: ATP-binding protein [Aureimonas]MBB3950574.1 hypothetical protein [Aureimonas jatrophae]
MRGAQHQGLQSSNTLAQGAFAPRRGRTAGPNPVRRRPEPPALRFRAQPVSSPFGTGRISGMARIRKLEIENFRGIRGLEWHPSPGFNCLVGPGDAGKSTVLDAIDLCLGARRNPQFTDSDFHGLDCDRSVAIRATVGDLPPDLQSFEAHGHHLRGYDPLLGSVEDEPGNGLDTVLTVELRVGDDLEPRWCLVSDRATRAGVERSLSWRDRLKLAPTRLSGAGGHHLGWSRGSILNRLSDERADVSAAVSRAARQTRSSLGTEAGSDLAKALASVHALSVRLGVPVGDGVTAMLDARSMAFGNGTISLHDEGGVPLQGLGLGSSRLLVAGMQREAGSGSSIVLVDELEHGLEPHRIHSLLSELGAADRREPLQVFATTHSPVVVKELSVGQLHVARRSREGIASLRRVAATEEMQKAVRACSEALLSRTVLVCEGPTEIGLVRGLDRFRTAGGSAPAGALGVAFVDGNGQNTYRRALAFQALGYRTAILRDRDKEPDPTEAAAFARSGGVTFAWRQGNATEDELFAALTDGAVGSMLDAAASCRTREHVDSNIRSLSNGKTTLDNVELDIVCGALDRETRAFLGKAANKGKWFKTITDMQDVASDVVGPDLSSADPEFVKVVNDVFGWLAGA